MKRALWIFIALYLAFIGTLEIFDLLNRPSKKQLTLEDFADENGLVFTLIGPQTENCFPVKLSVYVDGTYELQTSYHYPPPTGGDSTMIFRIIYDDPWQKGQSDFDILSLITRAISAEKEISDDNNIYYMTTGSNRIIMISTDNIKMKEYLELIDVQMLQCAEKSA